MKGFAIGVVVTAIAFAILAYFWSGIHFGAEDYVLQLVVVAVIFGVVNGLIKPIVKLFSLPITAITLGLFSLVINGAMLLLVAWVANEVFDVAFTVGGFPDERLSIDVIVTAIIGSIILSIITAVIGLVVHD